MKRKRPEKLSDAPKVTGQVAAQPRGNAGCGCKRGARQAPRCPRAGPKNAPTARSLRESCSGPARQGRCPPEGHQGLSPVPGSPVRPSPLEGTPAAGAALGEERGSQEAPAAAPAAFASAPWVSGVSSVNSAAPQRGFFAPETPNSRMLGHILHLLPAPSRTPLPFSPTSSILHSLLRGPP